MSRQVMILDKDTLWARYLAEQLKQTGLKLFCGYLDESAHDLLQGCRHQALVIGVEGGTDTLGREVISSARAVCPVMGILAMTPPLTLFERLKIMECGADLVLPKPADLREIQAHLWRMCNRRHYVQRNDRSRSIRFADFVVDRQRRALSWKEQSPVDLTGREYQLLEYLLERDNQVLSREQIASSVCGRALHEMDRSIDVMVANIRRKLRAYDPSESWIKSIRGKGYYFGGQVEW